MNQKKQLIAFFLAAAVVNTTTTASELQGYFADFTNFAVIHNINADDATVSVPSGYEGCNFDPPNVVFGANFTSGLAYRNGNLYGLEWDGGSGPDIYLYSLSAGPCASGDRIGVPVGFANLESLAYCPSDGYFYSVDFDFSSPHQGQLIRIDPDTGAGSSVGTHMSPDVRITGLFCSTQGQLWAVSSGFGGASGRNGELLMVNRDTGVEAPIGELGLPPNSVESLAQDPDVPGRFLALGFGLFEVDQITGNAKIVGGNFDKFWSMASVITDVILIDDFEGNTADVN